MFSEIVNSLQRNYLYELTIHAFYTLVLWLALDGDNLIKY